MAQISSNALFKKIVDVLKEHPYGLSSTDLARVLGINRMTLVKYLTVMQSRGIIEFKNIGMAKVWHTSTKFDLITTLTKDEAGSLQALVSGRDIKIREVLPDTVPLSFFRAVKAALAISKNSDKALYEAGQTIARNCLVSFPVKDHKIIVDYLSKTFLNLKMGVLEPIQISPSLWAFKLVESATAFGTMTKGNNLCYFEAGLISGVIENFIRKKAHVQETKCIGMNYPYCEFIVKFSK
jgi:predicted hydrocarbon binding protein